MSHAVPTIVAGVGIKLSDVRDAFNKTGAYSLAAAAAETINDCSAVPGDQAVPYVLRLWAGYDPHQAPLAVSGFSGNPGDDNSPANDPQQPSHVYMRWDALNCAASYQIFRSNTRTGSYLLVHTATTAGSFTDDLGAAATSRYYKIKGVSAATTYSPDTTNANALELRTTPSLPIPIAGASGYTTNGACDDPTTNLTISVTWTNGDAPGIRISEVEHRWKKVPLDGGTSYSAYVTNPLVSSGTASPTTFAIAQDVGTNHANGDVFNFQLRYKDFTGATPGAPVTRVVTLDDDCFA